MAFRALKRAQIAALRIWLDANQPHGSAALRAVQNANLCDAENWLKSSKLHGRFPESTRKEQAFS
jgi:hypothetical protein